ncbi:glycosyltransferase family 4 protein [Sphingomonas sp. JC676]|uniref:glycosyltransferase family 4 protein n=1 Tax=Sphingomonas sp. JC676 TaxID=2768065 RepID=UPI001657F748|nr:glycosyltransferase family 4 protein [Sphingomonas sp. JC676]MBC9031373.1 glycosyltransferase family 4 protein [Sphingomonas sp. JC676]
MRIAFILAALDAGGAERIIDLLSRAAVAEGWDVTIVTFDRPSDRIFHRYDEQVHLRRLALPIAAKRSARLLSMIRRVWALRRLLREERFDVAVSFLTKINALALLAGIGSGTPIIVSERNNPLRQRSNAIWRILLHRLYPTAAAIVMQTERSKICLPYTQRARAIVIPNPMLAPSAEPRSPAPPTMIAVGRLNEQKGFDLLLDAFAGIADKVPDWRLVIFGEGPERASLERQVRQLGLAGRAFLPGASATPGAWITACDIFVLSSRYEGFPNVLAEAMGSGLAVVAFDCDYGPGEMITDNVDGLLVPPENIDSLAAAMLRLATDKNLCQRLGAAAAAGAYRFDLQRVNKSWIDLIMKCTGPQ